MSTKTNQHNKWFLLIAAKAASQKDILDNSKERIQLNDTFMALNKRLKDVIKSNDATSLVQMQRLTLQFTHDVYARESDMQSLMLLSKVEEQFKLVQEPDKYKADVEYALGKKIASSLTKAPDDIVEQFAKRQRANMTKFSGFETPAEKQFMTLQKDMANALLKAYKMHQNYALGFDNTEKKVQGIER
ncbi:hypothetical protein LJB93_02060 [Desulfovibrio sp. OttesenSCG-928-F07]|nr:hypothetical protein [Desulfovibrio sp. OttesenSCG-928-F07]